MRPRRDGGLILTFIGCLGLVAAIVGTAMLVGHGLPGSQAEAPPMPAVRDVSPTPGGGTVGGIAATQTAQERQHELQLRSSPTPAPTASGAAAAAVAGQSTLPARQPVVAGPKS